MSQIVKGVRPSLKAIKPVLSQSNEEAKKRVLNLYKLWYRQVPYVGKFSGLKVQNKLSTVFKQLVFYPVF
jgi:hypothetical protein